MELEHLPEDAHDEAVAFLAVIFNASQDEQLLNRDLRHWKYYQPHPFCPETRCYVSRDAEGLTAHGGYCPVRYAHPDGIKTSFQVIDWAGAARSRGAGFILFQQLWQQADSHMGIGGSEDAQKVMRHIPSLRQLDGMVHCGYPLRPWGLMMKSEWTWKSPLKFARSLRWRAARTRRRLDAWKAVPVERLSQADAPLLVPANSIKYCPLLRTPELVNYWLQCPSCRVRAWRLEHAGNAVGVLVLAFLRHEARIVDLVVNQPSAPLTEAYSLATDLAAQDRDACELIGANSIAQVIEAMTGAGMVPRVTSDVFFGDPCKSFQPNLPIETNLTIGDGFYLESSRPYFLCL
jgi:hypothetical protein